MEHLVRLAVERVAATDPTPGDPFRGLYISDEHALTLAQDHAGADLDARIAQVIERLALGDLDACVLTLCLAPEVDPRFGRLFAYLHDDVTRRLATPRLVARLLAGKYGEAIVLECFARDARLRRVGALRLLDSEAEVPLAQRPVKVGERLVAAVLNSALGENRLARIARQVAAPSFDLGRSSTVAKVRHLVRASGRMPLLLTGPDAAEVLASAVGTPLLAVRLAEALDDSAVDELALDAALSESRICFEIKESGDPTQRAEVASALADLTERLGQRLLICAGSRAAAVPLHDLHALTIDIPLPSFDERLALWSTHGPGPSVREVAAKFRLSAAQISHAVEVALATAAMDGDDKPDATHLHHGARLASSRRLEELASRVEGDSRWEDLVLPARQVEALRTISAYLRHRDLVLSRWGYERIAGEGQGVKVLFFGDSGTGKTMAGGVLARELGLEMYRVDLAGIVSKYIGETEKNLDKIFEAASGSNAILFFDEADALFGKRSEVSDAHDRYANIEVAYLLQKMEGYSGAVILATNLRGNMDHAFLRRLDFAIEFPFPEPEQRRAIWQALLPATAPVADEVDVGVLAERFKLSGGSIRNCSLAAAFLAADDGMQITAEHLTRAIAAEYVKLGRLTVESEFNHRPSSAGAHIDGPRDS